MKYTLNWYDPSARRNYRYIICNRHVHVCSKCVTFYNLIYQLFLRNQILLQREADETGESEKMVSIGSVLCMKGIFLTMSTCIPSPSIFIFAFPPRNYITHMWQIEQCILYLFDEPSSYVGRSKAGVSHARQQCAGVLHTLSSFNDDLRQNVRYA